MVGSPFPETRGHRAMWCYAPGPVSHLAQVFALEDVFKREHLRREGKHCERRAVRMSCHAMRPFQTES